MTAEQFQALYDATVHVDQVLTSCYSMISFVVCVVLPVICVIWLLRKFLGPFLGEYF